MRAIFWKEWRELRVAAFAVALLAAIVGSVLKQNRDAAMHMIVLFAFLGLPLGAYQGFLDRRATQDAFLLHRPLSFTRLHAARTLAGAASLAFVAAVGLAVMFLVPWRRGVAGLEILVDPVTYPHWSDVTPGRVAFAVAACAATWAAARLGASARR